MSVSLALSIAVFIVGLPALWVQPSSLPDGLRRRHFLWLVGVLVRVFLLSAISMLLGAAVLHIVIRGGLPVDMSFYPTWLGLLAPVLAIISWVCAVSISYRASLLRRLGDKAIHQMTSRRGSADRRPFRKLLTRFRSNWHRHNVETPIDQLLYVGRHSNPGIEKLDVIREIGRVLSFASRSAGIVTGQPVELITKLPELVTAHAGQGSPTASDYRELVFTITSALGGGINRDAATHAAAVSALQRLTRDAAARGHLDVGTYAINALVQHLPLSALALAETTSGICSANHYHYVINVCNILARHAETDQTSETAFVWVLSALAGETEGTASEAAIRQLRHWRPSEQSCDAALHRAKASLLSLCRYDAADMVSRLEERLGEPSQPPPRVVGAG